MATGHDYYYRGYEFGYKVMLRAIIVRALRERGLHNTATGPCLSQPAQRVIDSSVVNRRCTCKAKPIDKRAIGERVTPLFASFAVCRSRT